MRYQLVEGGLEEDIFLNGRHEGQEGAQISTRQIRERKCEVSVG